MKAKYVVNGVVAWSGKVIGYSMCGQWATLQEDGTKRCDQVLRSHLVYG